MRIGAFLLLWLAITASDVLAQGAMRMHDLRRKTVDPLVLRLNFESDFSEGVVRDLSTSGNHATCNAELSQCPSLTTGPDGSRAGQFNGAYDDAANDGDYIAFGDVAPYAPSVSNMKTGTLAFWIKHDTGKANDVMNISTPFDMYDKTGQIGATNIGVPGSWQINRNFNQFYGLLIFGDDGVRLTPVTFGDSAVWTQHQTSGISAWHHYAMTWDGTNIRTYLDGVLKETGSQAGINAFNMGEYVAIGVYGHHEPRESSAFLYPNHGFVNGAMDEIRLYNKALTTAQVLRIYTTPSADPFVYEVKADGTEDYTTIQACATAAQPGWTCLVHPGTYSEHVVTGISGTSDAARITFRAKGLVTMRGFDVRDAYQTIQGFDITGALGGNEGYITMRVGGDYCDIDSNTVRDGAASTYGIHWLITTPVEAGANYCRVTGNKIYNLRSNMITTIGLNHLIERNTLTQNNLQDFFRPFGTGHIIRRNFLMDATDGSGQHPDIMQGFGGAGPMQDILFEENWVEDLQFDSQIGQMNSGDGDVPAGILWDNIKNVTWRRNVLVNVVSHGTMGIPGMTFEDNTFYHVATSSGGLTFSGSLSRGEFHNSTLRNNIFLGGGTGTVQSGWYSFSGMAFGVEAIGIFVTGEGVTGPNALLIQADLRTNGYIGAGDPNILAPARALTSIDDFVFSGALAAFKTDTYTYLVETATKDTAARASFDANYNFVAGDTPGFATKSTSGCPLDASNFCETNGINGGNPSLTSLTDFDGPDGVPFTLDDGLKPIVGSKLCTAGINGTTIGAYSCDTSKVLDR
jgi:hypothetical protein